MTARKEKLLRRNKMIEERYGHLCSKKPHYRNEHIVCLVADEFYLSVRTIYAVLSGEYERRWQKESAAAS